MSSHYIYLSCPVPDCSKFEQIYTGDIYTDDFPDSGPRSFEGEAIETPCNEHLDWEPEPIEPPTLQPTAEPSVTTAAERDALPIGHVVRSASGTIACRATEAFGVVFGNSRTFPWGDLALPLTVLYPAPQPAADTETEGVRHFAPWGTCRASCGATVPPGEAPESSGFTYRRHDTTCLDCRSHFTNLADTDTETEVQWGVRRPDGEVRTASSEEGAQRFVKQRPDWVVVKHTRTPWEEA